MNRTLLDIVNSPLFLLLFGFVLTTLAGSYITHSFHEQSWRSKARLEIFKERFKKANEMQDSTLLLSSKRINYLRRIIFELDEGRLQSARDIWKEYFVFVQEWNDNLRSNKNQLELLFGEKISIRFLDYNEDPEVPKSLHHILRKSHNSILDIIECMTKHKECDLEIKSNDAHRMLDLLGRAHDNFAVELQKALMQKENAFFTII